MLNLSSAILLLVGAYCTVTFAAPVDVEPSLDLNSTTSINGTDILTAGLPFRFTSGRKSFTGSVNTDVRFNRNEPISEVGAALKNWVARTLRFYPLTRDGLTLLDGVSLANGAEIVQYAGNVRMYGRWSATPQNLDLADVFADLRRVSHYVQDDPVLGRRFNCPLKVVIVDTRTRAAFFWEATKLAQVDNLHVASGNDFIAGDIYPTDTLDVNDARNVFAQMVAWASSSSADFFIPDATNINFVSGKLSLNFAYGGATFPEHGAYSYGRLLTILNLVQEKVEGPLHGVWTGFALGLGITARAGSPDRACAVLNLALGVRVPVDLQGNGGINMNATAKSADDITNLSLNLTSTVSRGDVSVYR